jgi:Tim10/DDP family zinc finger
VLGQVGVVLRVQLLFANISLFFANRCVTGSIGGRFSRGEESCLVNCVDRYVDTSLFVIKKVEEKGRSS